MKNDSMPSEGGDENTIIETKSESTPSICENIMRVKNWSKTCPKCNRDIFYKSRKQMLKSTEKKSLCKRCIRDIVRIVNGKMKCRGCKETKPVEAFAKRTQIRCGRDTFCKECRNKIQREANHSNPRRVKSHHLRQKYNIGLDEYESLLKNQDGVCAICHNPETKKLYNNPEKTFSLTVDHCHFTNKIRGLLCSKCNTSIGLLGENVNVLQSAIKYLEKYSTEKEN